MSCRCVKNKINISLAKQNLKRFLYEKKVLILGVVFTILIILSFRGELGKSEARPEFRFDWRMREFELMGINPEKMFQVECVLGTYYWVLKDNLIGIPILTNDSKMIKCSK